METNILLLSLLFGCATGLQCGIPGECYIMSIAGTAYTDLDDVELTSLDPELFPVPECLENLNPLPFEVWGHAGALDYSRKFCIVCHIFLVVMTF